MTSDGREVAKLSKRFYLSGENIIQGLLRLFDNGAHKGKTPKKPSEINYYEICVFSRFTSNTILPGILMIRGQSALNIKRDFC